MRPSASVCLLLLLAACGQDDAPPAQEQAAVAQPAAPSAPEDRLKEALSLADSGKHPESLAILEKLLAEKPTLEGIWDHLFQEAVSAGSAGALLDRLSVTDAVGGLTLQHHGLRASLALEAGRPQDALDAANALKNEFPADAAAFLALAVRAGGTLDLDKLDPAIPQDALILACIQPEPTRSLPLLKTAEAVTGWRAALVRAQLYSDLGDAAQAQAQLALVTDADGPYARLAALKLQASLATDPAARAELWAAAAGKAKEVHAGAALAEFVRNAVRDYLVNADVDKAFALARDHHEARKAGTGPDTAVLAAARIEAARVAGEVEDALAVAETAREYAPTLPDAARIAYARADARLSMEVCDIGGLYNMATLLPEPDRTAVRGLAAFCSGNWVKARGELVATGVDPTLAVGVSLAAAQANLGTAEGVARARAAVAAADESGELTARIESRLAWERQARLAGLPEVEAALKSLSALPQTPSLLMEVYARRSIRGDAAAVPPPAEAGESEVLAAWRALAGGSPPLAGDGMAAWARARQMLQAGDAASAFSELSKAISSLPALRQCMWAPTLALAGADGPNIRPDIAAASSLPEPDGPQVLLTLHDWSRFIKAARLTAALGDDLTDGLPSDKAKALKAAFAKEKSKDLLWLAKGGAYPDEAHKAVKDAMAGHNGLGGLKAAPTLAQVRQRLSETAIFSVYLEESGPGQILVVTPITSKVVPVKDSRNLRSLVQSYRKALLEGSAFSGRPTSPGAGDRVRAVVMDGAAQELTGIPRYLFLVPPDILLVPWQALPEQAEGRRYLADIRTIASAITLGPLLEERVPPENGYKPDFFGIGWTAADEALETTEPGSPTDEVSKTMEAAGLKNPGELNSIARLFGGGFSEVHEGAEARKEFFTKANRARYIHLSGVKPGVDGGFVWADGATTIGQIRSADLNARIVVISEAVDPLQQIARAHALLEAGVQSVVVSMWDTTPAVRSRFLTAFYDSLNRERTPARALAEARESLVGEALKGGPTLYDDPSFWGGYLLIGAP